MASLSSLLSLFPCIRSKNQSSSRGNRRLGLSYIPCRASNGVQTPMNSNPQEGDSMSKFDRRDVLFGLGGLYSAAALGRDRSALADPISPDVIHCEPITLEADEKVDCCPPSILDITDFVPPAVENLRVRPAAHLITQEQLAKLEEAVTKMKALDPDDPRNFYQQARVHCAYCNDAYKQDGFPELDFDIHWNWLFFPFHRCYLYFHERILGSLINDPDFAIPFWNWDAIPGMQMPAIYINDDKNSPLYDELRDPNHKPPKLLDLNYDGATEDPSYDVLFCNPRLMYRQMVINSKTAEGFHGKPLRAGQEAYRTGMGSIELSAHNNVHTWSGDPQQKYREDMGHFYAAARDPLFYAHHANVDRMWTIWQGLIDGKSRDFTDPDWLNASFVFYDENKNAIRIKVQDCLDNEKLGYKYQAVEIPWLHTKPIPRQKTSQLKSSKAQETPPIEVLNSKMTKEVKRPQRSRSKTQKSVEDEVLVIEMELDTTSRVHFNVLVNVLDDGTDVSPGNTEFAGSFKSIPLGHKHRANTSLSLVITELIEELGYDDDETVFVTIDPKLGGDLVTIGGIKIELQPIN
uniref:Polyphenol oxidase n=1 Tax=Luffa aegyptiaca TaxID=3670 RepID=A0A172DC01_LUFAE|nr:polyphenol oxidase [Luffa aegyptiaca]APO14263.1 polyphenol oxidase 4 [Luffa aegyptiaca]